MILITACGIRHHQTDTIEPRKMQAQYQTTLQTVFATLGLLYCPSAVAQTAQPTPTMEFSQEKIDSIAQLANDSGDLERGLKIFTRARLACFSCHRVGEAGGIIGPELAVVSKNRTAAQIVESLLWPNRVIDPAYQPIKIMTEEGSLITGYLSKEESSETEVAVIDPATRKITKVEKSAIESQANGLSLMPNGLVDSLSNQELADLTRFIIDISQSTNIDLPAIEAAIRAANTHEPASFPLIAAPLNSDANPNWKEHINRDRFYDFYTKQAIHFTRLDTRPSLLTSFPGLDGPSFGHWGNQNEAAWAGDEMNLAIQGRVLCNVLVTQPKPIARAVCLRLGDEPALSACFNSDTLGFEKMWTGGFVKFSSVRHGLMDGVTIDGKEVAVPVEAKPLRQWKPEFAKSDIRYQGYTVNNNQVLFQYAIDGVDYIDAPSFANGRFQRTVAPKQKHPMKSMLDGGSAQKDASIRTPITLGQGKGLVVDTIALPTDNPWKTLLYCGDHAFLSDGSAIVATVQGDVWKVDGISYVASQDGASQVAGDSTNQTATWHRIASGLHQPLGVAVRDDQVFVLGRNQITRLHDLNGDGTTDWYECFSNVFTTSPGGHDYICGLHVDKQGNFYTASGNEGVLQISADGKTSKVIATGLRNPDGLGLLPNGTVTVPASEGDWTPTSMIFQIEPREIDSSGNATYESNPSAFCGYRGPKEGQQITLPLLYLPRGVDNSSGGQVWVDEPRMGPLHGNIVHTSYGTGRAMVILRDQVGEQWQGAAVVLPGEFRAGSHRARLNPQDGLLYITGMSGWGTYTPDPGCFQRLRYTGDPVQMPTGFHIHSNGVSIKFRYPIDQATAEQSKKHFAQCWNYRYSPGYGSKEFSVLHQPMIGHDNLTIASSSVIDDGLTLFLELPDLQLCSQLHLRVQVGENEWQELFATVHAMDNDRTDIANVKSTANKIAMAHPMKRDLEWLKRSIPNPWRNRIDKNRNIRIESRDNLQYSTKTLECAAGEVIKLTFANPDVVPHNWALLKPGSLERIGEMANQLVNDPDAYLKHYVPESSDVLCFTDIVDPKDECSIYFVAPKMPGRYPYLCTFPGHWMVMNGELIVK
jgi:putative heme-binding domain-containing protein